MIQYKTMRERYGYSDCNCKFTLKNTNGLDSSYAKEFHGIFSGTVPQTHFDGINIRRFELIVKAVFADSSQANVVNKVTPNHIENLHEIVCAIVHWKMASQGGRAQYHATRVRKLWGDNTFKTLMEAYFKEDISLFRICGIAIPTASAILRFIFPEKYGIIDRRVVKITQEKGITNLNLRATDGYINNTRKNIDQYTNLYNPFLISEANKLLAAGIQFKDRDENGETADFNFRPCDIEMALFSSE